MGPDCEYGAGFYPPPPASLVQSRCAAAAARPGRPVHYGSPVGFNESESALFAAAAAPIVYGHLRRLEPGRASLPALCNCRAVCGHSGGFTAGPFDGMASRKLAALPARYSGGGGRYSGLAFGFRCALLFFRCL